MTLKKLSAVLFAAAATLALTATPAGATPAYACNSIIFNACVYPEPSFQGPEYRTVIYYHGCYTLPPSRSYHTDTEISGYFGFDIGFTALS